MATTTPATVSVALCTRNGERYIVEQLESILLQTPSPIQIVISDDGSTDATLERVRAVIAEHSATGAILPRFDILENPRPLGVTANFAQAVERCDGDVIVLCDQDDVWHPHRLAAGLEALEHADVTLVFSDAELVDGSGAPLGRRLLDSLEIPADDRQQLVSGRAAPLLLRRNLVTGATVLFRRSLLRHALPLPSSWVHDEWLAIIAACISRIRLVPEPLVDYRQHGANEIGVAAPTLSRKIRRVLQPRGSRNAELSEKFELLWERLLELGDLVPPDILARAATKARVEREREALPARRLARLPWIARAASRGWYRDYCSQGAKDILRDLLQPHDDHTLSR